MSEPLNRFHKYVQAARVKVRKYCGPFTEYFIEHFSDCAQKTYTRLILNITGDGRYKAIKCSIHLNYSNPYVDVTELGSFKMHHLGMDRIQQEVTVLEQNGFDFIDECNKIRFDVKAKTDLLLEKRLQCFSLKTFHERYTNQDAYTQVVEEGVHVIVVVDENAMVWYRPAGLKSNLGWLHAKDEHIEAVTVGLASLDGAQGFVGEGFYNGVQFVLTDISFLKDKWLFHLNALQRMECYLEAVNEQLMVLPKVAKYKRVKTSEIRTMCTKYKGIIVSVPQAMPCYALSQGDAVCRAMVTEHEPFEAYFGVKKTYDHSEVYDFDDFKYKGLLCHQLKIDLNGLTFTSCGFKPGDKTCAVFC